MSTSLVDTVLSFEFYIFCVRSMILAMGSGYSANLAGSRIMNILMVRVADERY